ncbi:MAG: hypothetical protein K9L26_02405 [Candidatus Izimaplasma sp.]|nr:hypothetical protein [Candidatus Izimaplasma bacterium]
MTVEKQMEILSDKVENEKRYFQIRKFANKGFIKPIEYKNQQPFQKVADIESNRVLYKHNEKPWYAILLNTTNDYQTEKTWNFYVLDYTNETHIDKMSQTLTSPKPEHHTLIGILLALGYIQIILSIVAGAFSIPSIGAMSLLIIFGGVTLGAILLALGYILDQFNA